MRGPIPAVPGQAEDTAYELWVRVNDIAAFPPDVTLFEPLPHELQLDIDDAEAFARFNACWPLFTRIEPHATFHTTRSKSGIGYHIRVSLFNEIDDRTRVAYQAALGSDPKRELFNLRRLNAGITPVFLLAETPEAAPGLLALGFKQWCGAVEEVATVEGQS